MNKRLFFLLLTTLFFSPCTGQNFIFHSNSPFGIQLVKNDSTRQAQKLMFVDYDNDGDVDILISGLDYFDDVDTLEWNNIHYFLEIQENIGDKWNPQFAERASDFEDFPFPLGYFLPSAGELNGDNKIDFVINGIVDFFGNRTPVYMKNTTRSLYQFESIRLDSLGLHAFLPESFFVPELIDLDMDGDLDFLMSGFDPAFGVEDGPDEPRYYYAKNTSDRAVEPEFLGWFPNPYGLVPNSNVEILTGGDIDNDGDMDLMGTTLLIPADSVNYIYVHLNSPDKNGKPHFDSVLLSPFGLPVTYGEIQMMFPNFVDVDGDGDLDLFVLTGNDNIVLAFYENELCMPTPGQLSTSICEGEEFEFGGNTFTEAGIYEVILEAENGCDSLVILTLELEPAFTTFLQENICDGDIYIVGNEILTASGDYTVILTASNGCDSIIYLSLTVDPIFSVGLSETICSGEIYVVGDQEFSTTGIYTVTLQSQSNCDSVISLSLNVVEVDNSITLSGNVLTANLSGASYQWFNCESGENIPGETNQSFTATVTGNYAVQLTDSMGCTSISGCTLVVISGIEEELYWQQLQLYPNPADYEFKIFNQTPFQIQAIDIINLYGHKHALNMANEKVSINHISPGIYFIHIKINDREVIKKLVVI